MARWSDRLTQGPVLWTAGYFLAVTGLVFTIWASLTGLRQDYADRDNAQALLDQIDGRAKPGAPGQTPGAPMPGSPYLEGRTVTVAGAALQQRIGNAVKAVGGNVLSLQVDLQGAEAKKGFVSLTASCEVEQSALQQLLYDIEAGMPFLFIDQLTVQAPQSGDTNGGRMRVLIGVSGLWQGARG